MASPTKETQKAAYSIADSGKNNTGTDKMGPTLQWHLGGGTNGIQHFLDHLMDPLVGLMKALGTPDVTPELKKTIADGVSQMAGGHSVEQLAQEENRLLVDLIKLRAQQAKALAAEAHA